MSEYLHAIRLGAATITLINVGDLRAEFVDYEAPSRIPIQCVLIQLPETCALVDACLYDLPADSPYAIPGYQPPPGLLARLAELGVAPDDVAHVIITHAHFDHYSATTTTSDGSHYQPAFPRARYYLGRGDWEAAETQAARQDATSLVAHTLDVLWRSGQLEPVAGDRHLSPGLDILAAPGESPGHQVVRVASEGQTLYCVGDLYHFASEVALGDAMPVWADRDAMLASRERINSAALAEAALLMATHVTGFGRLQRQGESLAWVDADVPELP